MAKKWPLKPGQYLCILFNKRGKLQLGPVSVTAEDPYFTQEPERLPINYETLKSIEGVELKVSESLPKKEDYIVRLEKKAKVREEDELSPVPLKWMGSVQYKQTAHGIFEKGVPKSGLTKKAVRDLISSNRFFVLG